MLHRMIRIASSRSVRSAVFAAVTLAAPLSAQQVRGTARVGGTTAPSSETAVVLVDSTGNVVAGAITDAAGRFALTAPSAGRYRLRARRIGFLPDSSPLLRLVPGAAVTFDPRLTQFVTRLQQIHVVATQRCVASPDRGAAAFRLWQDAQSALTATVVSSTSHQLGFVLRRFERSVDPATGAVREAKTWDTRAVTSEPYASIPAESLAVHGFVVPQGAFLVYYAPDARTLTSDVFARTHCYRAVTDAHHPGLLGLAFAPDGRTATRDVSGTLWLDGATGELRDLVFRYGTPSHAEREAGATASGRVEYRRLEGGTWIVSHWLIRMPVVTMHYAVAPSPGTTLGEGTIVSRVEVSGVVALWEAGGDVLGTFDPRDATAGGISPLGEISGRFVTNDTPASAPRGLGGVRVSLERAAQPAVNTAPAPGDSMTAARVTETDSSGAFAFDSLPPGDYVMRATSAYLDTLNVAIAPRIIHLTAATRQSLITSVPAPAAAASQMCPGDRAPHLMVVHGTVLDAPTGAPVPHARVEVSWLRVVSAGRQFNVATDRRIVRTGRGGDYTVCGLPAGQKFAVVATLGKHVLAPVMLDPNGPTVRMVNFSGTGATVTVTPQPAGPSSSIGRIIGSVHDTAGHAVSATVRVDSASWIHTSADGSFAFSGIAVGRHVIEARALGFAPHAWYVTVPATRAARAPLTLLHATRLGTVQVTAARDTTPLEPAGFLARRLSNSGGIFLDQQQIDRRGAQRLTDVLRDLPGVELASISGPLGTRDHVLVMRGTATAGSEVCPIQYYVDGHPFAQTDDIDRLISVRDVVALEVYPGASQVPPQFNGATARCGVIAIWTTGSETR